MALSLRLAALAGRSALQVAPCVVIGATPLCSDVTEVVHLQRRTSSAQAGSSTGPSTPPGLQLFENMVEGLQHKTEQELLQLIQKGREAAIKDAEGNAEDAEEEPEEDVEVPNPATGELYGPRGAEPTRYGDWEHKGKCIDF